MGKDLIMRGDKLIEAISADPVTVGQYRFDEYKWQSDVLRGATLWDRDVIVGINRGATMSGERLAIAPTDEVTVDSREVLDSLLVLASQAIPFTEKKSKNLLLRWCNRFGLPFCSIDASQKVGNLACSVRDFALFLFLLRDTFWKIESLQNGISQGPDLDFGRNPYFRIDGRFSTEEREKLISEFINDANIKLKVQYSNGEPMIYTNAGNLIDLAKYQLALLLFSRDKSTPKRCKCCNSMFLSQRKNQLYCRDCSPQKNYSKKRRQQGMEEK